MVCLDDLLWCNVDEDFSVNIRDCFGSCGGWTLLLRLLVCLFLVWFVNMDVTVICTRANRIFVRSLVYLVFPSGASFPLALFCGVLYDAGAAYFAVLFAFSWLCCGFVIAEDAHGAKGSELGPYYS